MLGQLVSRTSMRQPQVGDDLIRRGIHFPALYDAIPGGGSYGEHYRH
jgi:hypothetical protein